MINEELSVLINNAILSSRTETDLEEMERRDYSKVEDASLLRFLADIRGDEATSTQLRDDLMTMLIVGHETTAAVLTRTLYCSRSTRRLPRRQEINACVPDSNGVPTPEEVRKLQKVRMILAEGMRLYPAPSIFIRRAIEDVTLLEAVARKSPSRPELTVSSRCGTSAADRYQKRTRALDPSRFSTC